MGFMAKSTEKNKALYFRQKGESIKEIAKKIGVAKSTVSLWCRDIKLTAEQLARLYKKMVRGSYIGRLKGARVQYERRLKRIKDAENNGVEIIRKLTDRDLLLSGIALYWGEGSRKRREASFSNSDAEIIKFIIKWFRKIFNVKKEEFVLRVGINKIHKKRVDEVINYWSKITKIPKEQFRKTTLIKTKNKKFYNNFAIHYGTLTIKIKKSSEIYYQIMGLIKGLVSGNKQR